MPFYGSYQTSDGYKSERSLKFSAILSNFMTTELQSRQLNYTHYTSRSNAIEMIDSSCETFGSNDGESFASNVFSLWSLVIK